MSGLLINNPLLRDAIREERRADKALKAAADRFAQAIIKARAVGVANQYDGEGGYALEVVREALISAGVFNRPTRTATDSLRKPITANRRRAVFERDLYRCVCCGTHIELTIDHKHPVSLGGGNDIDNLQTMCMPCNAKKGVKVQP